MLVSIVVISPFLLLLQALFMSVVAGFTDQGRYLLQGEEKVREKSRECHNHKLQPFQDTKRKRKRTNPNKHKSNKLES